MISNLEIFFNNCLSGQTTSVLSSYGRFQITENLWFDLEGERGEKIRAKILNKNLKSRIRTGVISNFWMIFF